MEQIEFADFLRVDIRIGTIVAVEEYPEARKPAYKTDYAALQKRGISEVLTLGLPDSAGSQWL